MVGLLLAGTLSLLAPKQALVRNVGDNTVGVQRKNPQVVVVKTANVKAFQEVIDTFRERCRVPAKYLNFRPESPEDATRIREEAENATVVVAIGQPAAEAVQGLSPTIVYAMVPAPPSPGAPKASSSVGPKEALLALRTLRPELRRVGVLFTRRGLEKMAAARVSAREMGIEFEEKLVETSSIDSAIPDSIQAVHRMVFGDVTNPKPLPLVDALWIGPDLLVVDMPLLQYLLTVQLTGRVPILAGTRQLVAHGVLMSMDWSPEAVGQHLARQVLHFLEQAGRERQEALPDMPAAAPEILINGPAARRLNIDLHRLRKLGWKVHE
ncbi:MAG TPA: hypothetical protein PKE31_10025 [Pseudomonadota bacterium]|nr:hypothetical protein [Pseudomonadota bacterium]